MTSWEITINELYQLYMACKKRESQEVRKLVQQLTKRNVKFKLIVGNGTTTLHLMCFHGRLGMVKLLVEMYGNAEAKDENQRTPLHLACMQGHLETAQFLYYEWGYNLQCKDEGGWTPIDLAGFHNHIDIVRHFDASAPTEIQDLQKLFQGIKQLYLLFTAYKKRDFHLVPESNSHLCVINVKFVLKCENCFTTLHLMCAHGVLDRVKNVIEMYGSVEARDENGRSPLHIACKNGHIDVAEYLIHECGCDKEARDNKQFTPLFTACLEDQINTIKFLISKFRCKIDARDAEGRTPLHVACYHGFQKIVDYLINDCGCSPEVTDDQLQQTPLHWACAGGHLEIVKYLANECKCNTEARDKLKHTPLFIASLPSDSSSGPNNNNINTEVVSYLILEQGCDPDAENVEGVSPIQLFYINGELNMIKHCIKLKKHDPRTWKCTCQIRSDSNKQQDSLHHTRCSAFIYIQSPLHLACSKRGSMDVVKFLVEEYGFDPLEKVKVIGSDDIEEILHLFDPIKEDTVLTVADDVKIEVDSLTENTVNPIIQACHYGRLDMLQYLISKCGSAVSYYNLCGELMFMACNYGYNEIMGFLLKYSTLRVEDETGNTILHCAIAGKNVKGAYKIVRLLIASVSNLDQRNCLGETALHTVCKINPCRPDIIELLLSSGCNSQISNFAGKPPLWVTQSSEVFKIFMRYSPADVCERILSDDIDEEQSLELLHCLIQQYNWNPNDSTKNGDTALHLACKADRLTTVKYLFSIMINVLKYDPYAKNKLNQTPIELTSSQDIIRELIKYGNPIDLLINPVMDEEQILQLVKEIDKDKLNGTTANDNTALHLACLTDRTMIVRYLLRESKIDVNAKNVIDISPIQLTKNSEIIIELIRHGANPTDLYSYCRKVLGESKLLQTTVKVFVLGDSNAGKSTLISSLKKEGWFNYFINWSSIASTVADDAEPDLGIITHDFKSKQCGHITLYDFVGRRLFHESQSDLLRETAHSPRVLIIVINLSGSIEEIVSSLQYWLGFLEEMSSSDSEFKNHTIVVGSNMDKCRKDEMRKIGTFLQKRVNNIPSMDYHDFIALDCRSHSSSDFTKLRRCLAKLCVIARNPKSLAFNAHCFQVYIMDRFKGKVALSVCEILNKMRKEEEGVDQNDPLNFLSQSDFQLQNLCVELHKRSQILFLRDPMVNEIDFENSWLVIDKAKLISQLFEVFDSMTFKTLPSNNGILSFSIMSDLEPFKIYNSDMIVRFLCHLEYCKEVSDRETLQAITNSAHAILTSERSFFFPILVENSAPEGVWGGDADNFIYCCGWILQCTKPEQFFTSKFLQILILRVMFCNTYLGPSRASIPILLNCSLWKGGISWGNIFGAETLVEVLPNNKAVLFLMRCRDTNLARCMEHRARIIHQIRKCAKEFCGALKTRESLIFPSLVKKYPICSTPPKLLFDIEPLAFAVVNITSIEQPYASSLTGTNTMPIRDLLMFEPYFELSALIVQEICNINNPRYISCLTDDFLLRFAQQIRNSSLFIGMVTQILYDYHIMDANGDNLLSKLMEWRDTCHITYQQLHKCMDRFSIFTGLNIVVCLLIIKYYY
jgi:ankyrin repeat protein